LGSSGSFSEAALKHSRWKVTASGIRYLSISCLKYVRFYLSPFFD
jgi:hypothetical protein